MNKATPKTTVDALRVIFARFGLPRTIVTDNGLQLSTTFFRDLVNQNQVYQLTKAPYRAQCNGMAMSGEST